MKKVFIPFCFVALAAVASGNSVEVSKLPSSTQIFLKEFFAGSEVVSINVDNDIDVELANGVKIDFDKRGRWKIIKYKKSYNLEVLPVLVRDYLKANYPNQDITEIDRKGTGYEVMLNNKKLYFSSGGNYIG
jgi:hypothetical protein